MSRPWVCAALLAWMGLPAWAGPSLVANETVSFVSGPSSPAAEAETQTGTISVPGFWNPGLRAGISAQLWIPLDEHWSVAGSYGVFRDQRFCDTCKGGEGPGWLGDELLGTTDLQLSGTGRWTVGKVDVSVTGIAVLPASRDALVCNPMFGAPGLGLGVMGPLGDSVVGAQISALRPIYRFSAAPVGRCAPPLRGTSVVTTLTGAADPLPWDGTRFTGANATFTSSVVAFWQNPLRVLPGVSDKLTSAVSLGLDVQRNAREGATSVDTQTGPVELDRAYRPLNASVPWSVMVGVRPSQTLELRLSLSNRLPTWIADPGGTFLALPARTTIALQARQRFGNSTVLPRSQR